MREYLNLRNLVRAAIIVCLLLSLRASWLAALNHTTVLPVLLWGGAALPWAWLLPVLKRFAGELA